jgi:hypothetical protein
MPSRCVQQLIELQVDVCQIVECRKTYRATYSRTRCSRTRCVYSSNSRAPSAHGPISIGTVHSPSSTVLLNADVWPSLYPCTPLARLVRCTGEACARGRFVVIFLFHQHSYSHRGGVMRVPPPAFVLIRWRCQRDALHPFPALRIACPSAYRPRRCGHAPRGACSRLSRPCFSLRWLRQGERHQSVGRCLDSGYRRIASAVYVGMRPASFGFIYTRSGATLRLWQPGLWCCGVGLG